MLITLSLLPIYLLLLDGVTGENLKYSKKVLRRRTLVTRTYDSNHPPVIDTYDKIPVAVVYDDEEVIKVRNKNDEKYDVIVGKERKYSKHASSRKAINVEIPVNHPAGLHPLHGVDDSKQEIISKPRSRSIKIPVHVSSETKPNESAESGTGVTTRRRVKKVRKVKVNKSQRHAYVNELEKNINKEDQQKATPTAVSTRGEKTSTRAPEIFKNINKEDQQKATPTTVSTRGEKTSTSAPQIFKTINKEDQQKATPTAVSTRGDKTSTRAPQIFKNINKEDQQKATPTAVSTRGDKTSTRAPQIFKTINKEVQQKATPTAVSTRGDKTSTRAPQIFKNINKEDQQKAIPTAVSTRGEKTSTSAPQIFKARTGIREPVIPIIESESYVFSNSGDFHYSYEGGDGTKAYERGELRSINGGSGSAVEGNFSYKGEDGHDISLTYTADENGYRPVGAHLPTPPPIPIAIQRALAYLATKTEEPTTERLRTLKKKGGK